MSMNGYVAGGYLATICMTMAYVARILWRTRKLRAGLPPEDHQ